MPNYTKLFNSIVTSTIWTEDDKTRIVWITMLALSDQNGEIQSSVPGLARMAGVSVEATENAIKTFMSPDQYSRTPDNEGRRIAPIDGGWELLNHAKYRRMASLADKKESTAKRQKRFRDRNAPVTLSNAIVTHSNAPVTQKTDIAEAEAEAESNTLLSVTGRKEAILDSSYPPIIKTMWQLFPQKSRDRSSQKKIHDAWNKTKNKPEESVVIDALKKWVKFDDWTKQNGQYAPGAHLWVSDRKWESEIEEQPAFVGRNLWD